VAGEGAQAEITAAVMAAEEEFEFFRATDDFTLLRRRRQDHVLARMSEGRWINQLWARKLPSASWERVQDTRLRWHVRRYMVAGLDSQAIKWHKDFFGWLRRLAVVRFIVPPLKGGAVARGFVGEAKLSRRAFAEMLAEADPDLLPELRDEALLGYEHQRERIAAAEQRATFFLGAAGLTTSLVLANAGLLLGDESLESPWRWLAMAALGVASLLVIAAGLRALQATMNTFVRTPPGGVPRVMERRKGTESELLCAYIAALLVGQHRLSVIGEWKIKRMKSARRWFVGAIVAIVALTGFVLADIGEEQTDQGQEQQASAAGS